MIYLAIDGIENEFQNEVDRINGSLINQAQDVNTLEYTTNENNGGVVIVPPKNN